MILSDIVTLKKGTILYMADTPIIMPVDRFIRSVAINKNKPHSLLIGAGASLSSGMPSATDCIWEWKKIIATSKDHTLNKLLYDLSLPSVRQIIQRVLDNEGIYPSNGAKNEYSFYIEECFEPPDRQQYFKEKAQKSRPSNGYRFLVLLAEAGIVRSVWTPNFDGLVSRVAASSTEGLTVIEIGIDTQNRFLRQPGDNELLHVFLHGDYRYDALKNTSDEVRQLDEEMRNELVRHLRDNSLIVIGYSGRDQSIMDALKSAYSQKGSGRLYWCGYNSDPSPEVLNLLEVAYKHNRLAYYVNTEGFDDVMLQIAMNCLEDRYLERADTLRARALKGLEQSSPAFRLPSGGINGLLRSNAFEIECPKQVLQFEVPEITKTNDWKKLRFLTKSHEIVAELYGGKVLALGSISDIKSAFGNSITTEISYVPIDEDELKFVDGNIVSLMTDAIVKSIAKNAGLKIGRRGRTRYLWEKKQTLSKVVNGVKYDVHEAIEIYLRRFADTSYLIFTPTIKCILDGNLADLSIEKEIRRQILGKRYNNKYDASLNHWAQLVFSDQEFLQFSYPDNDSAFQFRIKSNTTFAKVNKLKSNYNLRLSSFFQKNTPHDCVEFPDTSLIFSNTQGDGFVTDIHPLRGMVKNRPYDFRKDEARLGRKIKLGVICPQKDSDKVETFLNSLQLKSSPRRPRDEYLLEYPGFAMAYGIPLDVPQKHNSAWHSIDEIDASASPEKGTKELYRRIVTGIDSLYRTEQPDVVIVYIPTRWDKWTYYRTISDVFDLHDQVKAYCIKRGNATQFLRDHTIDYFEKCRVKWWLSLALYAKPGHTPWAMESVDNSTAFIGIGYRVIPNAPKGQHIVLGCSHIYNEAGFGLGYYLSKVDDPKLDRRKNPYLSKNDARVISENTLQLLNNSSTGVPRRVVIHKRTPFRREEKEGFLEGLVSVKQVDMIEISQEPALRYLAINQVQNDSYTPHRFSVRRGTVVCLDHRRALLWVHGVTDAVFGKGYSYFLGGNGIPYPMMITRHYGSSSLSTLSREILGLSKMSWNSFDMYSAIPATIETSNVIAKIGVLLERFGSPTYDYRLFM